MLRGECGERGAKAGEEMKGYGDSSAYDTATPEKLLLCCIGCNNAGSI